MIVEVIKLNEIAKKMTIHKEEALPEMLFKTCNSRYGKSFGQSTWTLVTRLGHVFKAPS